MIIQDISVYDSKYVTLHYMRLNKINRAVSMMMLKMYLIDIRVLHLVNEKKPDRRNVVPIVALKAEYYLVLLFFILRKE